MTFPIMLFKAYFSFGSKLFCVCVWGSLFWLCLVFLFPLGFSHSFIFLPKHDAKNQCCCPLAGTQLKFRVVCQPPNI